MVIKYWDHNSNFGDVLNQIVWAQYFDESIINNKNINIFGIGSILNKKVESGDGVKYILGSGALGQKKPGWVKEAKIGWVRGVLTARALNIDLSYALGDPAILWDKLYESNLESRRDNFLVIPHWRTYC